jgi:cyanophycinase
MEWPADPAFCSATLDMFSIANRELIMLTRFGLFAALAGACFSTPVTRAEESLFGLPSPANAKQPGAVVLHGGGRISQDTFDRFVELAGGKNASIVFVPSAGFRRADYDSDEEFLAAVSHRYGSWVDLHESGRIRKFTFLSTDDPDDADDPDFVKPLADATGVWFSGGAQSRLNYRYVAAFPEKTKFQQLLKNVLVNGGVIGGTSAGTAALPEIMTLWEERGDNGAWPKVVAAHGLGLFDKAIVEQHFDARGGRLERFTGLLRDNDRLDDLTRRPGSGERMIGIGVEEPAALLARGNHFTVLGAGSVHVFLKSNAGRTISWHELRAGETAQLRRNVQQDVSLGREELTLHR